MSNKESNEEFNSSADNDYVAVPATESYDESRDRADTPHLSEFSEPGIRSRPKNLLSSLDKKKLAFFAFVALGAFGSILYGYYSYKKDISTVEIVDSSIATEEQRNINNVDIQDSDLSSKLESAKNRATVTEEASNRYPDELLETNEEDEELFALIRGGESVIQVGKIQEEIKKGGTQVTQPIINGTRELEVTYQRQANPNYLNVDQVKGDVANNLKYIQTDDGNIIKVSNDDRSLVENRVYAKTTRTDFNNSYSIDELTTIDCILVQQINSSYGGNVSCQVSDDVYSNNGLVVIPVGSTIYGSYASGTLAGGSNRLFISWNRVKTTYGLEFGLPQTYGAGALGQVGVEGNRNSQFFARFGQALAISFIGDLSTIIEEKGRQAAGLAESQTIVNPVTGLKYNNQFTSNTRTAIANVAQQLIGENVIAPTVEIPQGSLINVLVNQDVNLEKYKNIIEEFNAYISQNN